MKKYEKPAIEIVEANLSADCLQNLSDNPVVGDGSQRSSGMKDKDYDEDDGFGDGW